NKLFHIVYYIIISCLCLDLINTTKVSVNNKNDLINGFSKANNNNLSELIININDVTLDLTENIKVDSSVEKLHIIGKSKEKSVLNFSDIGNGIILTNLLYKTTQEIKFTNLTITGRLEFYSIVNVELEDVIINGSFLFDKSNNYIWDSGSDSSYNAEYMEKNLDVTITLKRILYNAYTNTAYRCINLFGNVIIDDSEFYGHSSCVDTILDYNGEYYNYLSISNSYFNGMHSNKCLKIYNSALATIDSCSFENGLANVYEE
ncbi:hypothetical protein BCR36DRAFT_306403, partial [Piromyces finnis]